MPRGKEHGAWRGGRRITQRGYVQLIIQPDDPRVGMAMSNGTVPGRSLRIYEHRYVMANALGRDLSPRESVHHLNGDTTDNRLENLQLRQGNHGRGVVRVCLDCGGHNIREEEI